MAFLRVHNCIKLGLVQPVDVTNARQPVVNHRALVASERAFVCHRGTDATTVVVTDDQDLKPTTRARARERERERGQSAVRNA